MEETVACSCTYVKIWRWHNDRCANGKCALHYVNVTNACKKVSYTAYSFLLTQPCEQDIPINQFINVNLIYLSYIPLKLHAQFICKLRLIYIFAKIMLWIQQSIILFCCTQNIHDKNMFSISNCTIIYILFSHGSQVILIQNSQIIVKKCRLLFSIKIFCR